MNLLALLLYAYSVTTDYAKLNYINRRLLDLGYCVECDNTGQVDEISCNKPTSVCCGGCEVKVECQNCK